MNATATVRFFFIVFAVVFFLESIGGFFMSTAVVFIERQFQIPSRLAGTMVSAGDFAYIPCVVFTSYFGGKGNRAKWLGSGCILIAVANLLIASSNFLFPAHNADDFAESAVALADGVAERVSSAIAFEAAGGGLLNVSLSAPSLSTSSALSILSNIPYAFCDDGLNKYRRTQAAADCIAHPPSLGPIIMIFFGLLILGAGRTVPYSLGVPLMDDNIRKRNVAVYFAIMICVRFLGPVLGMLLGGQLNKIYYNLKPPPGLTPSDLSWIGCWWAGFLLIGCILFFPSLLLATYPFERYAVEPADVVEMQPLSKAAGGKVTAVEQPAPVKKEARLVLFDRNKKQKASGRTIRDEFTDFIATLRTLLRTPVFMGNVVGGIVSVLSFKGYFVFLPKFLELQYGQPQHTIQQFLALTGFASFGPGVILGSIFMKVFKPTARQATSLLATCTSVYILTAFGRSLIGCESVSARLGQQITSPSAQLSACSTSCSCADMPLFPVCDSTGRPFFSPCQAGCPLDGRLFPLFRNGSGEGAAEAAVSDASFTRCACASEADGAVSSGNCATATHDCNWAFYMHMTLSAIGSFAGSLTIVPGMIIILRSVPQEHRSVSLGFHAFTLSLFATLPSPVFWGRIYDSACVQWQMGCEGASGACQLYDTDLLRIRIHVIYGIMACLGLVTDLWNVYWSKDLNISADDEEEKDAKEARAEESHDFAIST